MSDELFSAMKAQQWERAKGELRAMVALLGSQPAQYEEGTGDYIENKHWERLKSLTDDFIKEVEDYGLHE